MNRQLTNNIVEVGLTCSPSKLVETEPLDGYKVIVNHGNRSKTYYGLDISDGKDLIVNCIDGQSVEINQAFVISKERVKFLRIVTDNTAHANYHKRGNICKSSIQTRYILAGVEEKFSIKPIYLSSDSLKSRTVYDFTARS